MQTKAKHVSVCICTYKRPELLRRLLIELGHQVTEGMFTYSIVVVDNDRLESAKVVVSDFAATCAIPVRYCVESQQNIAMARNRAVENATGDFLAFIDDDEFPIQNWLLTLFKACGKYQADGALGPVKPHFDEKPPSWVIRGGFYQRATYETGLIIDWRKGRTGNVLLKRDLFISGEQPFRPEFRNGEDQDFFQRQIERGHVFVWCNEAVAYEVVPPSRWNRKFLLKRALLRGSVEPKTAGFGVRDIVRSLIAVSAYSLALPFALVIGQHKFMPM